MAVQPNHHEPEGLSPRNRRVWIGAVIVLGGVLLAFSAPRLLGLGGRTGEVLSAEAVRQPLVAGITERGTLRAAETITYSAPRLRRGGGQQIVELAPEGSMVEAGDLLVRFDNAALQESIRQQRTRLEVAEAERRKTEAEQESQMASLQANLETARHSHEQARLNLARLEFSAAVERRREELTFQKSVLSLQQAEEQIDTRRRMNAAGLQRSDMRLNRLREELAEMEAEMEESVLYAQQPGLVAYEQNWGPAGRTRIKVGDTPHPGQALVSLPDLNRMNVDIQISELEISRLGLAQEALIFVDAYPDTVYTGRVTEISPLARRLGNSQLRVFDVVVSVRGTDFNLRPGMTTRVNVITQYVPEALVVPVEAVFRREGRPFVYRLNGSVEEVEVVLGVQNVTHVVIEEGLQVGAWVALRDPRRPLESLESAGMDALRQQRQGAAGGGGEVSISFGSGGGGAIRVFR